MPSPIIVFGFVMATLVGAGFHLIVGGNFRRLSFFLLAAWIGFGLGHLAGVMFNIHFLAIGSLHLLPALAGAMVALLFIYALNASQPNSPTRRARRRPAR